ncbi:thioredoxin-disulfide reductase [Thermoanaerobacterium sp. RBIITD]|uniref:thioredoxin-disulfide reductase n=1 Tax=Thermoanaerobacterium sp. RBIITD TaxID=1550240 RepID=UPI000BB948D8|nr:thioredoxin-disulfide reductase [Thermoanaerobacterium sp. RBIITD]SNX54272.1 thioredoxin reductase (NADPH) [Thermoanaerobacterium sp. RBIITD]
MVREINANDFDEVVLKSKRPIVVDFYSTDCPPCAQLKPIFHRLAEAYGEYMDFIEIYRQGNKDFALSLGVKGSPTLVFFKDGKETGKRLNGYISKPDLRKAIESIIGFSLLDKEPEKVECDVLIMGGGPAGLTAALYSARANLNTIVLEEGITGGQTANTYFIENYPGTDGQIEGKKLTDNMRKQAESFGAKIDDLKEVFEINLTDSEKYVRTEDKIYYSKAVIVAMGAQPRKLPAEGEVEFRGKGIHYCAICDGAMYEGKHVAVIGGGNSAIQEALYLAKIADKITVIHEFDNLQASNILQDKAFSNPKINFIWESHVIKANGDGMLKSLTYKNLKTGVLNDVSVDGAFVYIGLTPKTDLFKGVLNLNKYSYIKTDDDLMTNVKGVFAAGDIRDKKIRQVVTAAGDGAVAAINAERYISEL